MPSIIRILRLALPVVLASMPAWAQITITANDFPGDRIGFTQEMLGGIDVYGSIPVNVGAAGENRMWDFSRVSFNLTPYTLAVNEASESRFTEEFAQLFGAAKVAVTIFPGFEMFCRKTSSRYESFGFGYANLQLGQVQIRACNSPVKTLQFPLTYGSSWTSEQMCTTLQGFQEVQVYSKQKNTVDGWGRIRLPAGTVPCLRIKTISEEQIQNPITGYAPVASSISYTWMAPGVHLLAYVESVQNENNPNFNHALSIIVAQEAPVQPETFSPQVTVQRTDPEPENTSNEPVDTRNFTPANPAPAAPLPAGNYYALVVAVQDYIDPSINDLEHPLPDAQNLINTLMADYTFAQQHLTFLKNPSREQIFDAFDQLSQRLTENDNLLVFYAGHGYWDERLKQGFWLPANARKSSRSEWLSNSTVRDYIYGIKSKHTLLISDACFGGGIFKTRTAFIGESRAIAELYKLPSRKAITSGTRNNEVPDRSVFVEYLLKHLRQNTDRYLNAQNLFTRFRDAVINNSPASQVPQYGEIRETGDEGGDFVLVKKK